MDRTIICIVATCQTGQNCCHIKKKHWSVAVPPACRTYLCSCAPFACACAKFCAWMLMKHLHALMSITGQKTKAKTPKLHFSTRWPWPLTWPSNSSERSSRSIPIPNFVTVCQSYQPWECSQLIHTHRQTDRAVVITSTADAGGHNASSVSVWEDHLSLHLPTAAAKVSGPWGLWHTTVYTFSQPIHVQRQSLTAPASLSEWCRLLINSSIRFVGMCCLF